MTTDQPPHAAHGRTASPYLLHLGPPGGNSRTYTGRTPGLHERLARHADAQTEPGEPEPDAHTEPEAG